MNQRAELHCPSCEWSVVCGPGAMLDWLRSAKMVRRGVEPELALVGELFRSAAAKYICPRCGSQGLIVREPPEEDDEEWQMTRVCQECGRPIPRERLEIFPDARLCVACQAASDRAESSAAAEYCPRCGSLMALGQSRSAGLAQYVMQCPKCRGASK